ncbi:uncharacterized protein LOC116967782 isoform X2 [Amblyraja radiata]|uniref:uncharacterized protein LOC116967782 isoform X2 n=1 Tax=Amblyraja radiata TaxID=386614 RepID=UPI001403EA49|nr:uncharacterized protein LOC116967782 isoform X2 [Amblyraja radiata]
MTQFDQHRRRELQNNNNPEQAQNLRRQTKKKVPRGSRICAIFKKHDAILTSEIDHSQVWNSMAKPFDEGTPSDPRAQERIGSSLANCSTSGRGQYLPHAHLPRCQGDYRDHSPTAPSFRGHLTCGMNATANSSLPGESQRIQSAMSDIDMTAASLQGNSFHIETGNDDALIRQVGIQLRLMGDQLHTSRMERVMERDQRHWPVLYWMFLNFCTHTLAIFRAPRWW